MTNLEIEIKQSAIAKIDASTKDKLFSDIEDIKALETGNEVLTGKTKNGFNFRKFLHSIVIF